FSTVSDLLDTVSARYCNADGNNFAVMPDGISSCTRVTRSSDELSEMFFIGSWDEEGLQIDENKVRELRGLNLYSFSSCDECFARFSCSGGCHHDRFSSSPPSMPEGHCEIIRMILWEKLRKMLSN
ncbi:MAG: SPASM domain-containing protein, partial [Patescibacteria group bacterium]|nr:SPASM domain-containing protein [Patescibacteria group bacterium]